MTINDLIPWKQKNKPVNRIQESETYPVLQNEFEQMLDNFFEDPWSAHPFDMINQNMSGFMPQMEIDESDKSYQVTVELPGMEEKDIQVNLNDGLLSICGEKRSESKDKKSGYYRSERSYGCFERQIRLSSNVNEKEIAATFKNGLLKITLPKHQVSSSPVKKITIKNG